MVPYVNSAEQARAAVAAMRYPPGGIRGVAALNRAADFGKGFGAYFASANQELLTILQIETPQAVEAADEIAAVDGADVLFIGPADLHASLGYIGERAHKDVLPVIEDAIKRIVKTGKAAGILADGEEGGRRWLAAGATFVGVGSDLGLLARGADALAAKFKS